MLTRTCIVMAVLMRCTSSKCDGEPLSDCSRCCSVLFSTPDCDPEQAFRIKVNGNGVLGAIWDNAPVVAIVRTGCLLELWDLQNQTGSHRAFGLDGYEVYHFDRYGYEGIASSARCTCISL